MKHRKIRIHIFTCDSDEARAQVAQGVCRIPLLRDTQKLCDTQSWATGSRCPHLSSTWTMGPLEVPLKLTNSVFREQKTKQNPPKRNKTGKPQLKKKKKSRIILRCHFQSLGTASTHSTRASTHFHSIFTCVGGIIYTNTHICTHRTAEVKEKKIPQQQADIFYQNYPRDKYAWITHF